MIDHHDNTLDYHEQEEDEVILKPRLLPFLVLIVIGVGILTSLLSMGIWQMGGLSLGDIQGGAELNLSERMIMRLGLIINHAGMFLIPGIAFVYIHYRHQVKKVLQIQHLGNPQQYLWWGAAILCSYPFIAGITEFNMSIPFPEWMQSAQEDSFTLLGNALTMESPIEFIANIILVGVFAALGEELIFRGILQRHLQQLWRSNPHVGIVIASVVFGGIHMQAERLLPLMFLGLLLGYAYHYTKNLWVPILLHFLNNSLQVTALYISGDTEKPVLDEVPDLPIIAVIISFLLTLALAYKASQVPIVSDESRP